MTVQTSTNVASFNGDGANKVFPIGYKFNSAADLVVTLIDDEAKTAQILTLNSDFTVTGAGDEEGGHVTLVVAPTVAQRLKVTRVVDILQLTDLRNQGKFYAEIHEDAFDLLTMIAQQHQTEIGDANDKADQAVETSDAAEAKVDDLQQQYADFTKNATWQPIGNYADSPLVITSHNQYVLRAGIPYRLSSGIKVPYTTTGDWAAESGNFVLLGDDVLRQELSSSIGASMIGGAGQVVGSIASLRAILKISPSKSAFVTGYYAAGDGGGGPYYLDAADTDSADNGGTVIVAADGGCWKLSVTGTLSARQFGAIGNNVADDTSSFTKALNYIQASSRVSKLYVPAGLYKITSPLPDIAKAITIQGDNPRDCMLMCSGTESLINIRGASTRATDITFRDIGINGYAMTDGYCVSVDFAQDVLFDNVLIADPFNAVSIRQAGVVSFNDTLIDGVRGSRGVFAYGENIPRNGENDQIDILCFSNSVIQSYYVPAGPVPVSELLVLDGRVHTVQISGLRLLSALRGIVTMNTPGLAANFAPRFFTGSSLEVESMYAECADFRACLDFFIDNFFAAGSAVTGVKLGSGVANWGINKGSINSNGLDGILIDGASDVTISDVVVYNNSLVAHATKSGIYIDGGGTIDIRGGLCGKAAWLPAYTEPQKAGIDLAPTFNGVITINGVDLRGNATFAMYDNNGTATGSQAAACPGYTPRGVSLQPVGGSPFAYTAGLTPESVNLYGGTGVVSTIVGVVVANNSPAAFTLQPRQTVSISYATAPTMAVSKG